MIRALGIVMVCLAALLSALLGYAAGYPDGYRVGMFDGWDWAVQQCTTDIANCKPVQK